MATALLASGQRRIDTAAGIQRIGPERRQRVVVGEHAERRAGERRYLDHRTAAEWRRRIRAGGHEDYHRAGDEPQKIDYDKMERVARTIYMTMWDVANLPTRPKVDKPLPQQLNQGRGE